MSSQGSPSLEDAVPVGVVSMRSATRRMQIGNPAVELPPTLLNDVGLLESFGPSIHNVVSVVSIVSFEKKKEKKKELRPERL
jgi:hypothetical protein